MSTENCIFGRVTNPKSQQLWTDNLTTYALLKFDETHTKHRVRSISDLVLPSNCVCKKEKGEGKKMVNERVLMGPNVKLV